MMKKLVLIYIVFFGFTFEVVANDIQISNVSLTKQNADLNFTMIKFDLTWENSWRISTGSSNWDAAWIFVKYRVGSGPWLHAFLNNTGHIAGTGTPATISPGLINTSNAFNATTNPAMGVFVHRSGDGTGTFTQSGLELRWNYGANSIADGEAVDIKVFAIEMVFVPSGSFQVGDGSTTSIQGNLRRGPTNTPYTISSENSITLGGTAAGNLGNNNATNMFPADDFKNSTTRTLPAAFPKGFNAFYCMKYEMTQQLWLDFFNCLTTAQKPARDITAGSYNNTGKASDNLRDRNNLRWTSGDAILNNGTHGNVACNFLSWMDGAAFLDWASLRPMSELEFEKACRGTLAPVANEFAWGTTSITGATGINNSGESNEVASNAGANIAYNNNANVRGPMRVGSFAKASSTRVQAGASFYGILDLSGNMHERCVSIGNSRGRNLTRSLHGDGMLTVNGFSDIASWPGFSSGSIVNSTGMGCRGGTYDFGSNNARVSARSLASFFLSNRNVNFSIRGVRSF